MANSRKNKERKSIMPASFLVIIVCILVLAMWCGFIYAIIELINMDRERKISQLRDDFRNAMLDGRLPKSKSASYLLINIDYALEHINNIAYLDKWFVSSNFKSYVLSLQIALQQGMAEEERKCIQDFQDRFNEIVHFNPEMLGAYLQELN